LQISRADGPRVDRWWSVQVTRFRDGYLLAWRDVTDELEVERVAQGARESALRELAAVGVLQEASLPKVMPSDPRMEVVARYEPVSEDMPVGGDWYDVFWLDDGRLGLVIADVAGHGREAASEMVQLRNKLRGASFAGDRPELVMHRINRMSIRTGAMATCQYAVLDLDRLELEWVSAGHLPMLHIPCEGAPRLIGPSGDMLLGVDRDHRFHSDRLALAPGDIVLLYTDGLVERRREHLDVGLARLVAAVSKGADLHSLVSDAVSHAPNAPREDDLCLLAIRVTGAGR
jgi:serine phosphatase RsbU (regulator of sigma subunit)